MSPEKTVLKLRSTPAPILTAALGAKPEVGPAPNRYVVPVSLIRGPRTSETGTISQPGDIPAAQGTPRWPALGAAPSTRCQGVSMTAKKGRGAKRSVRRWGRNYFVCSSDTSIEEREADVR